MAVSSRANGARMAGHVPGFASRADTHAAIEQSVHLKPSELGLLFHCSRGTVAKLVARADFPKPIDLTDDGNNLRYPLDEVLAWRAAHRREVRSLKRPKRAARPIAPPPSAEAAVRRGLAALRGEKKPDPTGFR